jgi:ABC-type glycerol-3-phosphate transport system substrate-binding protein
MINQPQLSRRRFLQFSALASGAMLLAACPAAAPAGQTQASNEQAAASEPAVITYWYAWGNLDPAMAKMVESEEFKNHVGGAKLEYKGSTGMDALLTAVAGGTPPDAGSNYQYVNLFTKGATIDVTDMVNASPLIKSDDILEGLWESAFWEGKMMGVPGIEGYLWWGLNVNTNVVKEAGLDATTLPKTWDEVLEWHKALTKKDDAGNLLQFGLDPYDAMANEPDFIAGSYGFTWWNEETGEFNLANERMAEGLNTMGEFIRICGPDQFAGLRQVEGNGTWGAAYNAGVQNMIMEGYWHPGETQIQKPEVAQFNVAGWAPVPADRKDANIMATGAHFVVVFKDGKNHDGAFKVGEFFNTDLAQDTIFKEVGWIHGRKSWLKKVDKNTYPGLAFYVEAADQVTEWTVGRRCPIYGFVTTQYTELREQVYRDLMAPEEAAAELQARAEAEWQAQGLGG